MDIWGKLKKDQYDQKYSRPGSERDVDQENSRSSLMFENGR